jgi:hypothetical protein
MIHAKNNSLSLKRTGTGNECLYHYKTVEKIPQLIAFHAYVLLLH